MAHTFKVLLITPSTDDEPGTITIEGDWVNAFTGQFFLNEETNTPYPIYEEQPANTVKVPATTFQLIDNNSFFGRYSVRSPKNDNLGELDRFLDSDGNTVIRVNEFIKPLRASENDANLFVGKIIHISTYIIQTADFTQYIYPKTVSKVLHLDLPGRGYENWGEIYTQNLVNMMYNSASLEEPDRKNTGQFWFDLNTNQLKVWANGNWIITTPPSAATSFLFEQTTASTTWVITHDLKIPYPHIAGFQSFIDRGFGPEMISPQKATFNNQNELTLTFSKPIKGWVKVIK